MTQPQLVGSADSGHLHAYPQWFRTAREACERDIQEVVRTRIHPEALCNPAVAAIFPGRRIRPTLYYSYWRAVRGTLPTEVHILPALALELFHAASIIVDDLADQELTRRNKLPLYRHYDADTAILTSHYLVATGYELLAHHPQGASLSACWTKAYSQAAQGQYSDISPSESSDPDTQAQCALRKTSPFFWFIGAAIQEDCPDVPLGDLAGITRALGEYFQISNDVVDILYVENSKRYDPSGSYYLRPSLVTALLVTSGRIRSGEIGTKVTYDRLLAISQLAAKEIPDVPMFLQRRFHEVQSALNSSGLSSGISDITHSFITHLLHPSFWMHSHE